MIKISINKKHYSGIYRWDEMSLRKFVELSSIPIPDGYADYVIADGNYDYERQDMIDQYLKTVADLTDKQIKEDFPAYYRKVVLCLSDIPNNLLTDQLTEGLYELHFRPFVVSLILNAPVISFAGQLKDYTPELIKSFKMNGSRYYLPETISNLGMDIPLAKESAISYLTAADLFRDLQMSKHASRLARFMAIYCRKKGEPYSDDIVLAREALFMDVQMSTVWNVFFCIARQLPISTRTSLLYGIKVQIGDLRESARHLRSTAVSD